MEIYICIYIYISLQIYKYVYVCMYVCMLASIPEFLEKRYRNVIKFDERFRIINDQKTTFRQTRGGMSQISSRYLFLLLSPISFAIFFKPKFVCYQNDGWFLSFKDVLLSVTIRFMINVFVMYNWKSYFSLKSKLTNVDFS